MEPAFMTVNEAAAYLRVGRSNFYASFIGPGRVPVVHIGRSARIPTKAVMAIAAELLAGASTASPEK